MMKIYLKTTDDSCKEVTVLRDKLKEHLVDDVQVGTVDMKLYMISPGLDAYDVIVELINDTNVHPELKIAYCFLPQTEKGVFDDHQLKSVKAIGEMVKNNGGTWFETTDAIIRHLTNTTQYA